MPRLSKGGGPQFLGIDLRKFAAHVIILVFAIGITVWQVNGIHAGGWKGLLLASLILGLLNFYLKPLVKRLTLPFYFLSLGVFAFVVNALFLEITSTIAEQLDIAFRVGTFTAALEGALVISIVSWILALLF